MNVVYLNPSGRIGGAERSLLDALSSLRHACPEATLRLICTEAGPLVGAAERIGVPTTVLPLPEPLASLGDGGRAGRGILLVRLLRSAPAAVRYLGRLREVLRLAEPDVVHSNGFKMHVLGAWAIPRRARLVWHVHDFVARRPVMSTLLRRHASRCAAAIANSHSVAEDLRRVCGPGLPVFTVHNGVDLETFAPDGPVLDLDAMSGLASAPQGTVRVGLVATLAWWKGHEVFLAAIARLPDSLPIRAYVVGGAMYATEGSQHSESELRKLALGLGVTERVGFVGYVENSATAMRALDVVVHASTEPEPFGLVIVEGMACGRAVVASRGGGAAELFTHERDALGHLPGDVGALAAAIERLVRDHSLREQLGRAARERAESGFDRRRLADALLSVYERVLAPGG